MAMVPKRQLPKRCRPYWCDIDWTECVPTPYCVEQVFEVSVPQDDEQQISTQDQRHTVEQEIDELLPKIQRAFRVGDISGTPPRSFNTSMTQTWQWCQTEIDSHHKQWCQIVR